MNRSVLKDTGRIPVEKLPPRTSGGQARILFVNILALGWRTEAAHLKAHTERRTDIDAVHLDVPKPVWFKVLGKQVFANGIDFHAWRYIRMAQGWVGGILRRRVDLDHFDMVHVMPHWYGLTFPALRQQRPSLRLAARLDQTGVLEVLEFGRNAVAARSTIGCERRIFRACDVLSSWSDWAARSLVRDYAQAPAKVVVARPSIQLVPSLTRKAASGEPCRMVFIGNDWNRKGGPRLLAMHQQRWADRAELHIVSANAEPDRSARGVVWHGVLPHERLTQELLPQMDFIVLMTREDCSPLVLLEAAAAGVPAVSVRLAGIPELVEEGRSGLLVPPGDWASFGEAVERMIQDPGLRSRFAEGARQHSAARFNPEENYGRLLGALVEGCRSPRSNENSSQALFSGRKEPQLA